MGVKKSDLSSLLLESLEAYYWIGFIMADGCIAHDTEIIINIAEQDEAHLQKFCDFIKKEKYCESNVDNIFIFNGKECIRQDVVRASAGDADLVPRICNKFDIKARKTYNPPNINIFKNMDDDHFLACFAGYIDGDGSVIHVGYNDDVRISLHCHATWLPVYEYFEERIYKCLGVTKIRNRDKKYSKIGKDGLVNMSLADNYLLSLFKQRIDGKIPLMERKWSKIKNTYYGRHQKTEDNRKAILELHNKGITAVEISKQLGLRRTKAHNILTRMGIQPILSRKPRKKKEENSVV